MEKILLFLISATLVGGGTDVDPLANRMSPVKLEIDQDACHVQLGICELKVEQDGITIHDLHDKVYALETKLLRSELDYEKLRKLYDQLSTRIVPLEQTGAYYAKWFYIVSAIATVSLMWIVSPLAWRMASSIISVLASVTMWFSRIPARLWSNLRARANVTEEIPLLDFAREANLASSPLQTKPIYDKSIFKIFTVNDEYPDMIHAVGMGCWMAIGDGIGYFVTATHCIASGGMLQLANANDESIVIRIAASEWKTIESYDVAYMEAKQTHISGLQIAKAKVIPTRLKETAVVTVYGRNASSMGPLKSIDGSVHVQYVGSTKPGFSGSPYIAGRTAYGMHLGSTSEVGYGLDASYISRLIRRAVVVVDESTEEWLYEQIEKSHARGKKIKYSDYGLDDVVIDINGYDFVYDKYSWWDIVEDNQDKVQKVQFHEMEEGRSNRKGKKHKKGKNGRFQYEADFIDAIEEGGPVPEKPPKQVSILRENYVDVPQLPKNVMTPTPALVSGETIVATAQIHSNPKLSKLSPSALEEKVTLGPTSTPAVSSGVSADTLKSIFDMLEKQLSQIQRLESKLETSSQQQSGQSAAYYPKKKK